MQLDTTSKISGMDELTISERAEIDGDIEMLSNMMHITMAETASLVLKSLGSISATALTIDGGNVDVTGHIRAQRSVKSECSPYRFDCLANSSVYEEGCDYTLHINSKGLTVRENGVIAAGAMRICVEGAFQLSGFGTVSASGLGHQANKGLGAGDVSPPPPTVQATGAGSGGSHGGKGGPAGNYHNVTGMHGMGKYDEPLAPGHMGSGGGGSRGGQGGGVLHIQASGGLYVYGHSQLNADGGAAASPTAHRDGGWPWWGGDTLVAPTADEGGSGGGAGGTIFLRVATVVIDHQAMVHANGGNGALPGGGGGGGGIVHLEPLPEQDTWPQPLDASILELVSAQGGEGGKPIVSDEHPDDTGGGRGGTSYLTGFNCSEGYSGALCAPCQVRVRRSRARLPLPLPLAYLPLPACTPSRLHTLPPAPPPSVARLPLPLGPRALNGVPGACLVAGGLLQVQSRRTELLAVPQRHVR